MAESIEKRLLWADLDRIIERLAKPIGGVLCDKHESPLCMLRDRKLDPKPSTGPQTNRVVVRVDELTETRRELEEFRRRLKELYG